MSSRKSPQNSLFTFLGALANPDHSISSNSQFYLYCFLHHLKCQLLQAQSLLFTFHNFRRCCVSSWRFFLGFRFLPFDNQVWPQQQVVFSFMPKFRSSLQNRVIGLDLKRSVILHFLFSTIISVFSLFYFFVDAIYLTRPFLQFHPPFLVMHCFIYFITNSLLH